MNPAQSLYGPVILPVIRSVREILLPYFGKIESRFKLSDKKFEVVTELDEKVELFLKSEFARLYPQIIFSGEETGGDKSAERFWLVDPIDGTAHFIRGIPFCATMVALIENGKVVFSAIYDFVSDVMYSAEKGIGAFANEQPIHVNNKSLRKSYLTFETHIDKEENLKWFLELRKESVLWHFGPAGFELAMVASGKLEGRVCVDPHGKDYDFAPGAFLVSEAGGTVANIGSRNYDYRNGNFIAANPLVFKELTEGPNAIFPTL